MHVKTQIRNAVLAILNDAGYTSPFVDHTTAIPSDAIPAVVVNTADDSPLDVAEAGEIRGSDNKVVITRELQLEIGALVRSGDSADAESILEVIERFIYEDASARLKNPTNPLLSLVKHYWLGNTVVEISGEGDSPFISQMSTWHFRYRHRAVQPDTPVP